MYMIDLPEDIDLNEILEKYYDGQTIQSLIDEYGLDIKPGIFLQIFPLMHYEDIKCPYCNNEMVSKVPSRTSMTTGRGLPTINCQICTHINNVGCRCEGCIVIAEREHKKRKSLSNQRIRSYQYTQRDAIIDIKTLSLHEALYITALARSGLNESGDMIHALSNCTESLSPNSILDIKILEYLYKNKIIDISIASDEDAFSFNGDLLAIDYINARWQFNFGIHYEENITLITKIESSIRNIDDWTHAWVVESIELWSELALYECISYLEVRLNEHGFQLRVGDKTKEVIRNILAKFSISQAFNFIWCSVRDAAAYYLRANISKQQAANTVIGGCQRKSERALNEDWPVKSFNRDYRSPESILVSYYINVVTDLGPDFLLKAPNDEFMGINYS